MLDFFGRILYSKATDFFIGSRTHLATKTHRRFVGEYFESEEERMAGARSSSLPSKEEELQWCRAADYLSIVQAGSLAALPLLYVGNHLIGREMIDPEPLIPWALTVKLCTYATSRLLEGRFNRLNRIAYSESKIGDLDREFQTIIEGDNRRD